MVETTEIKAYFNKGVDQRQAMLTRDDAVGFNYREKRYWFCRRLREIRGRHLDIGANNGNLGWLIRDFGISEDDLKVFGVDITDEAIRAASNRDIAGAHFQTGSATDLPFEDCYFDAVTMVEMIEHLTDKLTALREASRVLKPGGLLLLSTPNADCAPWHKDERLRGRLLRLLGRDLVDKDELVSIEELGDLCGKAGLEPVEGPHFYWYRPYRQLMGRVWWPPQFAIRGLLATMRKCIEIEAQGVLTDQQRRSQSQSLLLAARKPLSYNRGARPQCPAPSSP